MKVVIVGESPVNPSGFGQQVKLLAEGLINKGNSVLCISQDHPVKKLENIKEFRLSNLYELEAIDRTLYQESPDVVICFWHTQAIHQFTKLKYPRTSSKCYFWFPWEASNVPEWHRPWLNLVEKNSVVHLSEFAKKLWSELPTPHVIPHSVDPEVFKPLGISKEKLRDELSEKLNVYLKNDELLILNLDRNIWHKRWDATFDFVSKFQIKSKKRVRLIAHTHKHQNAPSPLNGYDLLNLEKSYSLRENAVVYTDFGWDKGFSTEDLAKLYNLVDLRISTSEGEGFGIPTVEASACKCMQIVNNTTTMPELFPTGSTCLVEPSLTEARGGALYQVPSVSKMVSLAEKLLYKTSSKEAEAILEKNRNHVISKFTTNLVVDAWQNLISTSRTSLDDKWYSNRKTYSFKSSELEDFKDVVSVIKRLSPSPNVLEVGCFTGNFIQYCLKAGIFIRGVENDPVAISKCPTSIVPYVTLASEFESWPVSDIIVATDCFSLLETEFTKTLLKKCLDAKWLIYRGNPEYRKGHETHDLSWIDTYLESLGAVRRHDIETKILEKSSNFTHSLWHFGDGISVPKGFCK